MQLFEFVRNLVDPILTIFIARNVVVTPSSFAASKFDVIIVGGGTAGLVVEDVEIRQSDLEDVFLEVMNRKGVAA